MPSLLDIAFALCVAVGIAGMAGAYADVRLKRQIAAGVSNARLGAQRWTVAVQWVVAAATLLLWQHAGRSWTVLGLVPPNDWRLWIGLGLTALVAAFVVRQNRRVGRLTPARMDKLQDRIASMEMILPHDEREYRWFMVLSCTAGFCEELVYRGFLPWVVAAYTGMPLAVVIVSACFGAGHAYQGPKGILRTGAGALVMSAIVLASGWLVPAMVIHALSNVSDGVLGFRLIRHRQARQAATLAVA